MFPGHEDTGRVALALRLVFLFGVLVRGAAKGLLRRGGFVGSTVQIYVAVSHLLWKVPPPLPLSAAYLLLLCLLVLLLLLPCAPSYVPSSSSCSSSS